MNDSDYETMAECNPDVLWTLIANSVVNTSVINLPMGVTFNRSEVAHLYRGYLAAHLIDSIVFPIVSVALSALGLIGCSFILITMMHASYNQRITFKAFMIALAMSDFTFNLFVIPFITISRLSIFNNTPHKALPQTVIVSLGVVNFFSLFADLTAISMTFERYLSLLKPFYWHGKSDRWKARFCATSLMLNLCISALRLYKPLKFRVEAVQSAETNRTHYFISSSSFYDSMANNVLGLICDIALPLVMAVVMLYLSIHTAVLVKRQRKIWPARNNTVTTNEGKNTAGNVTVFSVTARSFDSERKKRAREFGNVNMLMFCTATVTIVCEVAYTYLWLLYAFLDGSAIGIVHKCTNNAEICARLRNYVIGRFSASVTNAIEFTARMCNFYGYVVFSSVFRCQFREQMCGLTNTLKKLFSTN